MIFRADYVFNQIMILDPFSDLVYSTYACYSPFTVFSNFLKEDKLLEDTHLKNIFPELV
ncbi:hypothetical protein DSECCO2_242150 [anaerobic digester metagenome]